jgi:hypothetical protein
MGFPVQAVPAGNASKADRLYARSNRFESGQVLLPRKAHWLDTYVDELTTFPDSDFADQVDSTSQALTWDASSTSFNNAIGALKLMNDPYGGTPEKMIKLWVMNDEGGTIVSGDGSRRPSIQIPPKGEILEIDEKTGVSLVQSQWTKFQIVPE